MPVSPCRAPANTSKVFRTELWLSAMNLADNLPLNRYVLGYDVLGFQVGSRQQGQTAGRSLCGFASCIFSATPVPPLM